MQPIREKLFNKYIPRAKLRAKESGSTLRFVVVDLSPVTDVDATAVHFLHDFVRLTQIDGLQVMLANPSRRVVAALMRGGLPELIGGSACPRIIVHFHVRFHGQLEHAIARRLLGSDGPGVLLLEACDEQSM